ncbi:Hpt domain-containing protein [bacterium]|nr:Hpt domain-containing protein [bacterium]
MAEPRNAASLLSHSLKTPLSSVKVAAQLLRKHIQDQLTEKDRELMEAIIRNVSTLEARLNKIIELSTPLQDRIFVELELDQLEAIHSIKTEIVSKPTEQTSGEIIHTEKLVIHADPEIADLIPKFLDNRQKDIVMIESALETNDFETIRLLGHSMKGAGGGYGFDGVTEIGKNLEEAAKEADSNKIRNGVDELAEYLRKVEVIYDEQ